MKKFWVKIIPYNKNLVTTALESGADAVLIPSGCTKKVKELGLIATIAGDGDLKLGGDVIEIVINSKEDEERAAKLNRDKFLIIQTGNWKVIPLENLVAQRRGLIALVKNAQEAKLALGILEKGVDGILMDTRDVNEIKRTSRIIKEGMEKLILCRAKIINIRQVGMGDRVCIDTCTNMKIGQGMLIGNTSSGMFLVHSESVENPYVASRPFRVNAGGVHAFTRIPDGKTKYLSDLKSGDGILIVDHKDNTQVGIVGRIKVEKRPMILIEGVPAESGSIEKHPISLVMQNAETIRLTKPGGKPISIVKLKPGDEVLGYEEER
ncbi:3-dehydroquinate synthase [Candidatus Desantisbacteria bacterium CG1_02_38_46]|uniref:3-dehydroquinate synthase II n=2 Tax=unclassified Candidatus Desantisiibacteriota TaxID=3106372 RepID=A0A2H9PC45_9BACT|nr:MAG: 3-dehydroquinate synthase [Candidatus Desantisbacteria bacterium CG1_02_38_46]PIZ16625.1 MAG: 3-dehydroquinate synthase II [Candidatus Desantisbacteria bacterium CG_4_10_14_0_8_um_filter_39_17]